MTGLEKILAQIECDSDNACADIKKRTDARCANIIVAAENRAELIIKKGQEDAALKYDEIITRAKSTADLERRSVILKAKQEIISSTLSSACEHLCTLPTNEYFDLICKMASKYSEDNTGEICFSASDLARLPEDFEKKLSDCIRGRLSISKVPVDIDGGFILVYGGIEVNCGFSSIFSAESERFSDEASRILFA